MENHHATGSEYKTVRLMFDGLQLEDKVLFLVEATFATIGKAFEQAGRAVLDEVDAFTRKAEEKKTPEPGPGGPGPSTL